MLFPINVFKHNELKFQEHVATILPEGEIQMEVWSILSNLYNQQNKMQSYILSHFLCGSVVYHFVHEVMSSH